MFQLISYETEDGKTPVSDFLDSLEDKMAAKLTGLMEILEEKGTELRPQKSSWQRSGGPTGSDAMSMINDKRWFP